MRALLMGAAALLLAACATPEPLQPLPVQRVAVATATLTTPGTCEHAIAATFNEVIHARRVAAAMLNANRITVERAKRVQAIADEARGHLDRACPQPLAKVPPDAAALERAKALVTSLHFLTRLP